MALIEHKASSTQNVPQDKICELITDRIAKLDILEYPKYLAELANVGVRLDDDPGAIGLSKLNVKIAQIDAQKTRVGYILTQALNNENDIDAVLSFIKRVYEKRRADCLKRDDIKNLSSQPLREAAVVESLEIILDLKVDAEEMLSKAKTFTKIVQQLFDMLDSTNKNISRQLTTIQTMIETGEIQRQMRGNNPGSTWNDN